MGPRSSVGITKGKGRPKTAKRFGGYLRQMLDNLNSCPLTTPAEKSKLLDVVDDCAKASSPHAHSMKRILAIMTGVKEYGHDNGLFFKGPRASFISGKTVVVRAQNKIWFVANIEWRLRLTMSAPRAKSEASIILSKLRSKSGLKTLKSDRRKAKIPLHEHGYPLFIGDPKSAKPKILEHIRQFPCRAGLAPESRAREEYVLIWLEVDSGHTPRFPDSCGYIYWRPGGKTYPIEKCPRKLSGLSEAVTDRRCLEHIHSELNVFVREV